MFVVLPWMIPQIILGPQEPWFSLNSEGGNPGGKWRCTTCIPFRCVDTLESVDCTAWTSLCVWLKSFFSAPERGFSVSTKPQFSLPHHNQGSPQEHSKSSLTAQSNDSPLTNSIPMKHRLSPGNRVLLWVKAESRLKERKKTIEEDQAVACGDALLHRCLVYLFLKCHFTSNS